MILYYALTKYHQIACMVHKILYAKNEKAHLYLTNINNIDNEDIYKLQETEIFEEVVIMDDKAAWGIANKYNLSDVEEFSNAIKTIKELCEASLLFPLESYSDIYVAADHCTLGIVLVANEIPYHYIEEATGAYSNYDLWLDIMKKQNNKFSCIVAEKYGLQGRGNCVIDKWIDIDNQQNLLIRSESDNIIDFPVTKLLRELDDELQKKIRRCFNANELILKSEKRGALILTEYLSHGRFCSWEEHREIYGRLIDYFCSDMEIFLKPHPNDYEGMYGRWYSNTIVIDRKIPSEIFSLCFEKKFECCISISSTSAPTFKELAHKLYWFRNKDLRSYELLKSMDLYYVAVEILKTYLRGQRIYGLGADCLQIEYLLDNLGVENTKIEEVDTTEEIEKSENKVVFIDDLKYTQSVNEFKIRKLLQNADENDFFMFINSKNDVLFFDPDMQWANYTIPIEIKIKRKNTTSTHWMYLYTRSLKMQKEVLVKTIDKILKNAEINIEVNNKEKTVRERMLEGMLNATEQKCIQLISRK